MSTVHGLLATDCGTGHYFDFLICRHLVLNLFLLRLSTEKLSASSIIIVKAEWIHIWASPFLSRPLYCAYNIGAVIFTPLMDEVQQRKKILRNIFIGAAGLTCFAYKHIGCNTVPVMLGVSSYKALIVLVLHCSYSFTYFPETCLEIGQYWPETEIWQNQGR